MRLNSQSSDYEQITKCVRWLVIGDDAIHIHTTNSISFKSIYRTGWGRLIRTRLIQSST